MPTATPPRLGQMLIDEGVLTRSQLGEALKRQEEMGARLGEVLVDMGMVAESHLMQLLGQQSGIPAVNLRIQLIDPKVVPIIPQEKAELYHVIAMFKVHNDLTVAMSDPHSLFVIDDLENITGCQILPVLCQAADIDEQIDAHYNKELDMVEFLQRLDDHDMMAADQVRESDEISDDDVEAEDESPVINLINVIILNAVRERASDIHIEPSEGNTRVRLRIDGVLHETMQPPARVHAAMVSRIKVMAKMDIAERRLPQDGRIHLTVDNRNVNVRVSTMPTVVGEKVVLRLLDKSNLVMDLTQLGFRADTLPVLERMLAMPHGIFLVTGPTGSGKTTTLYSALDRLATPEQNTITVEDPVEYQLDMINQVQVNEHIGLTFAAALRTILRQDPDIVMVGEIRDGETASVAIQAALTGHLVLSTLHTNDSAGAVTRLLNMGVEPYLLSSAMVGVLAQRLLRRICNECRTKYFPEETVLDRIGWPGDERGRAFPCGKGCPTCFGTGLRGRQGIYELLDVDRTMRELIMTGASTDKLREARDRSGYRSLHQEGLLCVREGITTVEEVLRVAMADAEAE